MTSRVRPTKEDPRAKVERPGRKFQPSGDLKYSNIKIGVMAGGLLTLGLWSLSTLQ